MAAVRLERIHHVGYVVEDIDAALPVYRERFGMDVQVRETLPEQQVEAVLLGSGPGHVELIRPTAPDGGVARFLERRGPGMHHVAFSVPDLAAALDELAAGGAELIDRVPRRGLGGHLVAFIHPRSSGGVLTELVEAHE
ncbi:MAG: methylmalonyl-CoA epimerase [Thermoleophilia bacterium]|jgi:methylmalonyl-CoA/ethylmalonyl-CoA epimerase|nr:methylmalonyl-CoA epimerase [Thermoleophilia bacterium]